MLKNVVKLLLIGSVISGLCAPAQANTTMPVATASAMTASAVSAAAAGSTQSFSVINNNARPIFPVRVVVLLPLRSSLLMDAAVAVRAGIQAAYARESAGITVTVMETGDSAQEVLSAYLQALDQFDIVIGPLARTNVATVAQSGAVRKPTIVLTQPDAIVLPDNMLAIGLSVEEEARQAAQWAGAGINKTSKAFVVASQASWQRRAARAFVAEWQALGLAQQSIELTSESGYLSASELAELKFRLEEDKPEVLFAALSAAQAAQVRAFIGKDTVMYGTSQLNARTVEQRRRSAPNYALNDVRLIDMPWQLQPDHPAVMVYPQQVLAAEQQPNADLARLYALGIDAYRVAKKLAARDGSFVIDGVTGALTVKFGNGPAAFKRIEQAAVFQQGELLPVDAGR